MKQWKYPMIDMAKTGQNIKRIMCLKGLTVKNIQEFLKLNTPQSIYHWFDGRSLPSIDNLYALSELFEMSVDDLIIGNRRYEKPANILTIDPRKFKEPVEILTIGDRRYEKPVDILITDDRNSEKPVDILITDIRDYETNSYLYSINTFMRSLMYCQLLSKYHSA